MSPIHLFFRDYTGTFFAILLIVSLYFAMILPSSSSKWLKDFFRLHGEVEIDGQQLFAKSIHDIQTVFSLAVLLLTLRYFLSNTLFRLIAQVMNIHNSLDQPHIEHKCEVNSSHGLHSQEQAWLVLYYTFSFSAGITIIRKYIGFTLNNVWLEYPQLYYPWDFKLFYLTQCSFYVTLIVVLFIEVETNNPNKSQKHRKDLWEMLFVGE